MSGLAPDRRSDASLPVCQRPADRSGRGRGDDAVVHEFHAAADPQERGTKPVKPILIVDYGMANLRSVQKAFEKVGASAIISDDPNRIAEAERLVLPGVGAFRDAIARLREANFVEPI